VLRENRKCNSGRLLQSGIAEPGDRGLLTIEGFYVDRDVAGNKLILTSAEGNTIAVQINGKDALPDSVTHSRLNQNAPGFICAGKAIFDNCEVKLHGVPR